MKKIISKVAIASSLCACGLNSQGGLNAHHNQGSAVSDLSQKELSMYRGFMDDTFNGSSGCGLSILLPLTSSHGFKKRKKAEKKPSTLQEIRQAIKGVFTRKQG